MQASLSIKHGGLGIRQVRSLALPAFWLQPRPASTSDLQSRILSASACTTDIYFDSFLLAWQTAHGPLSPADSLPAKQSFWDKQGILLPELPWSPLFRTLVRKPGFWRLFIAPDSGDRLSAHPVTSCGLRLTDDAVRVAVALRLGCSVCVAHTCRCGELVDTQGCLLYTSPSPRDRTRSRMPSSA